MKQLVEELSLAVTITLVRSCKNRADALPRVPREWLHDNVVAAAVVSSGDPSIGAAISDVHERAGHAGVQKTLYFARRDVSKDVKRSDVQKTVQSVMCAGLLTRHPSSYFTGPLRWKDCVSIWQSTSRITNRSHTSR